MATGIDAQILAEDETTFQFQDTLESLPLPSLDNTLKRYLDSVKPHVSDEEFRHVEFLCQQFATGEGKVLHEKLLAKVRTSRNWLEKWWEDVAYMEGRLPNPLMNMAGPGPYLYDVWKPKSGTLIPRMAMVLYYTVEFWQFIRREKIRPHRNAQGKPLCMNQFMKLYSTCKIPGLQRDQLVHHFKTESEGPAPTHVAVMCKGYVFVVQSVDEASNTLTVPEFQSQLQKIYDTASALPPITGVGYFSTLERTEWGKIRSELLAYHPQNFHSLQSIETALVVIGLDDHSPPDVDDLCWHGMFGNPNNKWFDKSMNFVGYENGLFIANCDHSPMDGMMLVFSTYYVHCKLLECDGQWKGPTGVRSLPEPVHLKFYMDSHLTQCLQDAKSQFAALGASVEAKISYFTGYGKEYLKSRRVHPDTCFQLALQLAYYRMYNKYAPTYETATIRRFYHARTETVRSCTPESCQWCRAMGNKSTSDSERLRLFKTAVDKHNEWMSDATNLQGCDRHLFGLGMVAREEGRPIPDIFLHPSFFKSGGGGNYILSTSCIGYTTVFGGVAPMCPHGYGVFYCIRDDRFVIFVTCWTEDEDTSGKTFSNHVHQALADIRLLLDNAKASAAHL